MREMKKKEKKKAFAISATLMHATFFSLSIRFYFAGRPAELDRSIDDVNWLARSRQESEKKANEMVTFLIIAHTLHSANI